MTSRDSQSFFELSTEQVLDAVEAGVQKNKPGVRATGRILALNSLENRVYEIELEDQSFVVAKFYRPNRWSGDQISEEHQFLQQLLDAEIPVVAPWELSDSKHSKLTNQSTLAISPSGIFFAVFPKVKGRLTDELSKTQLETLGRYVARIHIAGSRSIAKYRERLNIETFGWEALELIVNSPRLDDVIGPHYEDAAHRFLELAEPLFASVPLITIHGDCHLGNTLWSGEAPFFLDFDDMTVGPAVQDIWMIIRGRDADAIKQREILLAAYSQIRDFDYESLKLIEPLRGLRIIHYCAWIEKRWNDPLFLQTFPNYGSPSYWREEIEALNEISDLIESKTP